tara:strand:- start:1619 stop:2386 length:768 start_codon:yes stop_codon:yes gene_type:complete
MSSENVLYEYPLNEKIRTYLRLEYLFNHCGYFVMGSSPWEHRSAIELLFDLHTVIERSEIRADLIKDLERKRRALSALMDVPNVDKKRLSQFLDELASATVRIQKTDLRIGQRIKCNELLNSIRQRTSIPGGACNFDLPAYHYWLQQPIEKKREQLNLWLGEFNPVFHGLGLLLKIIRDSGQVFPVEAKGGFYQHDFAGADYELLRIQLPREYSFFPEFSGNKHRIAIRFLIPSTSERPQPVKESITFNLCCCSG